MPGYYRIGYPNRSVEFIAEKVDSSNELFPVFFSKM